MHHFIFMQMIVIYCCASTLGKAFEYLQTAFNKVQAQLHQLKLVLNAENAKCMVFSNSRKRESNLNIGTVQGVTIEQVSSYKYLVF